MKKCYRKENNSHYKIVNSFLLSVIILLGSLVACNYSSKIKDYYQNTILSKNIRFSDFKKVYHFFVKEPQEEMLVFQEQTIYPIEKINHSTKIFYGEDPIYFLKPGIIVYLGEKDDLGMTMIVQGNDGVDIWYSNLSNTEYHLYDYVSVKDIIGEASNGELIVTIDHDGYYLNYEEYMEN